MRLLQGNEQGCGCQKTAGGPEGEEPCGPRKQPRTERMSFMIRLAKITFSGRNTTRLELWEEHLKDPIAGPGQSPEVRGRSVLKLARGFVEARQQCPAIGWCQI